MSPSPLHYFGPEDDRDQVVVPMARAPRPDGPRQTGTSVLTGRTLNRRWIVISVLAHLLIIEVLMLGLLEAPQPVPTPVLKITLVPQGPGGEGAAGGKRETPAAQPAAEATAPSDAVAAPEPAEPEISPPVPEQITPPTPPTPEIPKPTPPTPEIPPPAPEPIKQPQTPPAPKPPKPMATVPAPQIAVAVPPPKPRHIPPRHQAARHRDAPARVAPTTVPTPALTPAPTAPAQTSPATALATPGIGAGPGKGVEGAGKGAIGNTAGPGDDYLDRLYRHLLRYKKYPPEALSAKQQGSVVVGFTIARDGAISGARIEKSSGSAILDQATLTMVQRASPAPALPGTYKGSEARVKFPIDYKLSLIDQMF